MSELAEFSEGLENSILDYVLCIGFTVNN